MAMLESNSTVVGKLRVRTRSSDLHTHQRIQEFVRNSTIKPVGLPRSAILVVRHLSGLSTLRLPAGFCADEGAGWQRAVNCKLEELLAEASRPAAQAVPAGANAVLFLNKAEVLASLAADWLQGMLSSNWWWQWVFPAGAVRQAALLTEWTRSPEFIAVAMQILAEKSLAVNFARAIPNKDAELMRRCVCHAHAIREILPDDLPAMSRLSVGNLPPDKSLESSDCSAAPDESKRADGNDHVRNVKNTLANAPWILWAKEASARQLTIEARLFLAQTLMLARMPSVARSSDFQIKLAEWARSARDTESRNILFETVAEAWAPAKVPPNANASLDAGNSTGTYAPGPLESLLMRQSVKPNGDVQQLQSSQDLPANTLAESGAALANNGAESTPRPLGDAPADIPVPRLSQTKFGGVFFLLNVALRLDLYSDFTAPLGPNLLLSIWDFLALVGSKFTAGKIEQDEIWNLLAELAGRRHENRPGHGFDPPEEWHIPSDWLKAFETIPASVPCVRQGRSQIEHPEGFLIQDLSCGKDGPLDHDFRMERWLSWICAYIRARLVLALGRPDAVQVVCTCDANVVSTATHLEVTFDLEKHPVEIRIAGLDRNPGWIPAAGRHVSFCFESAMKTVRRDPAREKE